MIAYFQVKNMPLTITRRLLGFCLILFVACDGDTPTPDAATSGNEFNLPEHFKYERINDDLTYAYHRSGPYTLAEGYLKNGQKQGYWFSFFNNRNKIEKIEHYVNGKLHGPLREFSLNGRLTKEAFYENGHLEGPYTEYKFDALLEQAYYEDGELEGERRIYFDDNQLRGQIQQRITYKDGKIHGTHKYYDEKGNVVLEYKYENGIRIEEK